MFKLELDKALQKVGLGKMCEQKEKFFRSDDPPKNNILQINRLVGPPINPIITEENKFIFRIDKQIAFTKKEYLSYLKINTEKLIDCYQRQIDCIDALTNGNILALSKADVIAQRKHFYFCFLESILKAPIHTAFDNLNIIVSLQKLFLNLSFKQSNIIPPLQVCCREKNCPQIAIYGSFYCGWHILNDSMQQMFVQCPKCHWPRSSNKHISPQCCGHKHKKNRKHNASGKV